MKRFPPEIVIMHDVEMILFDVVVIYSGLNKKAFPNYWE